MSFDEEPQTRAVSEAGWAEAKASASASKVTYYILETKAGLEEHNIDTGMIWQGAVKLLNLAS